MCVGEVLYCDVIARSHLHTLIDSFCSKLCANKEEGKPMMVKNKLDSAMDESSVDQEICKSDVTVHNL